VCGLGWSAEESLSLLSSHVDMNGNTEALRESFS
jgi:hypothetical protein